MVSWHLVFCLGEIQKATEEVSSDVEGGRQNIARPPFAQLIPDIPSKLKNPFSSQGNLIGVSIRVTKKLRHIIKIIIGMNC